MGAPPGALVRDNRFEIAVTVCLAAMATGSWPAGLAALIALPCLVAYARRYRSLRAVTPVEPALLAATPPRSSLSVVFAIAGAALLLSGLLASARDAPTGRGVLLLAQFATIPATALVFACAPRGSDLATALWRGVTAGAVMAGLGAAAQISAGMKRPDGLGENAIVFGDIALVMAALSVSLVPAVSVERRPARWIAAVAGASGLLASLLSGSRGGWLAVPLIGALLAMQFRRSLGRTQWMRSLGLAAGVIVLVGWSSRGVLRSRLGTAATEVVGYAGAGPHDPAAGTSIGARFEAWRSAFDAFGQHPLTGIGWGNLARFFDAQAYAGHRNPRIATFEHPHHQLLSSMASAGVFGAAACIAVLAIPAVWFWRAMRGADDRNVALGSSGLIVVGGFAIAGLTEAVFESFIPVAFYSVAVAAIATQLPTDAPTPDHSDPSVARPRTLAAHRGGTAVSRQRKRAVQPAVGTRTDELIYVRRNRADRAPTRHWVRSAR